MIRVFAYALDESYSKYTTSIAPALIISYNNHMVYLSTIGSKRRVVIPAEICQEAKLNKGSKIGFSIDQSGNIVITPANKLINKFQQAIKALSEITPSKKR